MVPTLNFISVWPFSLDKMICLFWRVGWVSQALSFIISVEECGECKEKGFIGGQTKFSCNKNKNTRVKTVV